MRPEPAREAAYLTLGWFRLRTALVSPGVRTTKAYQGDRVREDESAGDQMISKMGRQTVRYAG